jgi:hypothetical protein
MMVYLHVPRMFPIKNYHFSQGIPHVQTKTLGKGSKLRKELEKKNRKRQRVIRTSNRRQQTIMDTKSQQEDILVMQNCLLLTTVKT